jgi:hypothetical protein
MDVVVNMAVVQPSLRKTPSEEQQLR